MESVEIQTSLTQADWLAYQTHWTERNLGDQRKQDPDGFVLGPSSIVLDGTGIEIVKAGSRSRYAWSIVQDLAWTDRHLFVWLDPVAAFIVPLRDLPTGLDPAQLKEKIHAFRSAHAQYTNEPAPFAPEEASSALPDDASPSGQQTTPPEPAPFKRFIRAYATLLLGRTPAADDLTIRSKAVLLLPAVGLAMWLIVDRWRAGAGAEFMPYGVFAWSWYAVILLASVWAASRLVRPHVSYERILVLAAAFVPVVSGVGARTAAVGQARLGVRDLTGDRELRRVLPGRRPSLVDRSSPSESSVDACGDFVCGRLADALFGLQRDLLVLARRIRARQFGLLGRHAAVRGAHVRAAQANRQRRERLAAPRRPFRYCLFRRLRRTG